MKGLPDLTKIVQENIELNQEQISETIDLLVNAEVSETEKADFLTAMNQKENQLRSSVYSLMNSEGEPSNRILKISPRMPLIYVEQVGIKRGASTFRHLFPLF